MGLDMYVYKTPQIFEAEVDFDVNEDLLELVHYWRKHPNLHGWMECLYRSKGGKAKHFNCVNVLLTSEDLDQLRAYILSEELPETAGFFFGNSDGTEKSDDLLFIDKAKESLAEGKRLFYHPWW